MTPSPDVVGLFDPASHTITYVVSDPATGATALIDPVLDYDAAAARISTGSVDGLMKLLAARGLKLERVLETHAHADHLTGAHVLRGRSGAPVGIGARITEVQKTFAAVFDADDVASTAQPSTTCGPTATASRSASSRFKSSIRPATRRPASAIASAMPSL